MAGTNSQRPRDSRFPKERRLLHKKGYQRVFREGRKSVRPSLVVYVLPRPDSVEGGDSRLGMAVSRKVGNAVVRNLARRRIREIYRLHHQDLLFPADIVVVGRFNLGKVSYQKMEKELLSALEQGKVLKPESSE